MYQEKLFGSGHQAFPPIYDLEPPPLSPDDEKLRQSSLTHDTANDWAEFGDFSQVSEHQATSDLPVKLHSSSSASTYKSQLISESRDNTNIENDDSAFGMFYGGDNSENEFSTFEAFTDNKVDSLKIDFKEINHETSNNINKDFADFSTKPNNNTAHDDFGAFGDFSSNIDFGFESSSGEVDNIESNFQNVKSFNELNSCGNLQESAGNISIKQNTEGQETSSISTDFQMSDKNLQNIQENLFTNFSDTTIQQESYNNTIKKDTEFYAFEDAKTTNDCDVDFNNTIEIRSNESLSDNVKLDMIENDDEEFVRDATIPSVAQKHELEIESVDNNKSKVHELEFDFTNKNINECNEEVIWKSSESHESSKELYSSEVIANDVNKVDNNDLNSTGYRINESIEDDSEVSKFTAFEEPKFLNSSFDCKDLDNTTYDTETFEEPKNVNNDLEDTRDFVSIEEPSVSKNDVELQQSENFGSESEKSFQDNKNENESDFTTFKETKSAKNNENTAEFAAFEEVKVDNVFSSSKSDLTTFEETKTDDNFLDNSDFTTFEETKPENSVHSENISEFEETKQDLHSENNSEFAAFEDSKVDKMSNNAEFTAFEKTNIDFSDNSDFTAFEETKPEKYDHSENISEFAEFKETKQDIHSENNSEFAAFEDSKVDKMSNNAEFTAFEKTNIDFSDNSDFTAFEETKPDDFKIEKPKVDNYANSSVFATVEETKSEKVDHSENISEFTDFKETKIDNNFSITSDFSTFKESEKKKNDCSENSSEFTAFQEIKIGENNFSDSPEFTAFEGTIPAKNEISYPASFNNENYVSADSEFSAFEETNLEKDENIDDNLKFTTFEENKNDEIHSFPSHSGFSAFEETIADNVQSENVSEFAAFKDANLDGETWTSASECGFEAFEESVDNNNGWGNFNNTDVNKHFSEVSSKPGSKLFVQTRNSTKLCFGKLWSEHDSDEKSIGNKRLYDLSVYLENKWKPNEETSLWSELLFFDEEERWSLKFFMSTIFKSQICSFNIDYQAVQQKTHGKISAGLSTPTLSPSHSLSSLEADNPFGILVPQPAAVLPSKNTLLAQSQNKKDMLVREPSISSYKKDSGSEPPSETASLDLDFFMGGIGPVVTSTNNLNNKDSTSMDLLDINLTSTTIPPSDLSLQPNSMQRDEVQLKVDHQAEVLNKLANIKSFQKKDSKQNTIADITDENFNKNNVMSTTEKPISDLPYNLDNDADNEFTGFESAPNINHNKPSDEFTAFTSNIDKPDIHDPEPNNKNVFDAFTSNIDKPDIHDPEPNNKNVFDAFTTDHNIKNKNDTVTNADGVKNKIEFSANTNSYNLDFEKPVNSFSSSETIIPKKYVPNLQSNTMNVNTFCYSMEPPPFDVENFPDDNENIQSNYEQVFQTTDSTNLETDKKISHSENTFSDWAQNIEPPNQTVHPDDTHSQNNTETFTSHNTFDDKTEIDDLSNSFSSFSNPIPSIPEPKNQLETQTMNFEFDSNSYKQHDSKVYTDFFGNVISTESDKKKENSFTNNIFNSNKNSTEINFGEFTSTSASKTENTTKSIDQFSSNVEAGVDKSRSFNNVEWDSNNRTADFDSFSTNPSNMDFNNKIFSMSSNKNAPHQNENDFNSFDITSNLSFSKTTGSNAIMQADLNDQNVSISSHDKINSPVNSDTDFGNFSAFDNIPSISQTFESNIIKPQQKALNSRSPSHGKIHSPVSSDTDFGNFGAFNNIPSISQTFESNNRSPSISSHDKIHSPVSSDTDFGNFSTFDNAPKKSQSKMSTEQENKSEFGDFNAFGFTSNISSTTATSKNFESGVPYDISNKNDADFGDFSVFDNPSSISHPSGGDENKSFAATSIPDNANIVISQSIKDNNFIKPKILYDQYDKYAIFKSLENENIDIKNVESTDNEMYMPMQKENSSTNNPVIHNENSNMKLLQSKTLPTASNSNTLLPFSNILSSSQLASQKSESLNFDTATPVFHQNNLSTPATSTDFNTSIINPNASFDNFVTFKSNPENVSKNNVSPSNFNASFSDFQTHSVPPITANDSFGDFTTYPENTFQNSNQNITNSSATFQVNSNLSSFPKPSTQLPFEGQKTITVECKSSFEMTQPSNQQIENSSANLFANFPQQANSTTCNLEPITHATSGNWQGYSQSQFSPAFSSANTEIIQPFTFTNPQISETAKQTQNNQSEFGDFEAFASVQQTSQNNLSFPTQQLQSQHTNSVSNMLNFGPSNVSQSNSNISPQNYQYTNNTSMNNLYSDQFGNQSQGQYQPQPQFGMQTAGQFGNQQPSQFGMQTAGQYGNQPVTQFGSQAQEQFGHRHFPQQMPNQNHQFNNTAIQNHQFNNTANQNHQFNNTANRMFQQQQYIRHQNPNYPHQTLANKKSGPKKYHPSPGNDVFADLNLKSNAEQLSLKMGTNVSKNKHQKLRLNEMGKTEK